VPYLYSYNIWTPPPLLPSPQRSMQMKSRHGYTSPSPSVCISFFFCREPFSPDLGRYLAVEAGCGRHLFTSQLAEVGGMRGGSRLCRWWCGLDEVCLKTTCRQGTRDRFSWGSKRWASLLIYFSLPFSPTLWCVEGMNRWTRGLLSSFLYLVSLRTRSVLG